MRSSIVLVAISCSCLAACSSRGSGSTASPVGATFDPPPPLAGYTRLTSSTVHAVPPGSDVTYCEYVMPPLDHDVDVLQVTGYQSAFGHHAVAFTYTPGPNDVLGASFPCMGTEFNAGGSADAGALSAGSQGTFLGGIGGNASSGKDSTSLPEGVAFRLKKGSGVMLNVHYINTGATEIDGDAVVDLQLAEPDPSRKIAALFVNLNMGFELSPVGKTSSTVDCVAESDVQVIMMTNHMHELGTSASTELLRAGGGGTEMLHEDPAWSYDMQFNPVYSRWPATSPLTIHSGDTIRTTCNWANPGAEAVKFPREMCVGVGFVLTTGDHPTAPSCAQGTWIGNGF